MLCSGKCGREGAGPADSQGRWPAEEDRKRSWCDSCWADLVVYRRMPAGLVKYLPPGTQVAFAPAPVSGPELNSLARIEHKIVTGAGIKSVATIGAAPGTATGNGTFQGYLAVTGNRDHGGVDHHGLRIAGAWMPTERAQALRQMVRNGAKLGLSIDYLTDASRPDGKGGRLLDRITVVGGAVTPKPMNAAAVITEGKHAASAPVVTVAQDIADGSARRDPDRDRIRREDQLLAAVDWPPPGLFDRETSLALIRGAAAAKTLAVPADEGEAMLAARYEENNNYSNGLARWMAAHRPRR